MRSLPERWTTRERRSATPHRTTRDCSSHVEDRSVARVACQPRHERRKEGAMIEVRSSAFSEGDTLPVDFTCDGDNLSPPLSWSSVPEGATELRISVRDPDAPSGTFTHWLVVGVDPASTEVGQGA